MTRVHHTRPQLAGHRSIALHQPRAVVRKKKPYKIVLEAVTQEKKKLHSILTYASNAPTGFGFVPAGHPEFTEWCKEQCRQRNLDVHIVSAKPKNKMHADPEKLSHHVHRVGHHFPLEIVNLACSKFGYVYDETSGLRKDKSRERTNWIAQGVEAYSSRQLLHGRPTTEKESKEHTRGAVREMFPKIPEADLDSIVNHAFEEGTNRVGNAKELSLARRVQLAVVAHIRHVYTDYDKMLKTGTWMQARQNVEHVSLAKLKEWRDESGEQSNEIEDTFREVIVLDDDDESSDEGTLSTPDEREQSMEIVSSRATARDLQPEIYANYPRMEDHGMRRVPRRTIMVPTYSRPAPPPADPYRRPVSQAVPGHVQQYVPLPLPEARPPPPREDTYRSAHMPPVESSKPTAYHVPGRVQPSLMQEIDGQLYHLEPIRESLGPSRHPEQHGLKPHVAPRHVQNGYVQSQRESRSFDRSSAHSRRPSEQDIVLPSVEREAIDLTSPRRMIHTKPPGAISRPSSRDYTSSQQPKRKSYPSFTDDRDGLIAYDHKRPRPLYHEDSLPPRTTARSVHAGNSQPVDQRGQHRQPPSHQLINLTSSPHQASTHGGERRHDFPIPDSSRPSYAPMYSRASPAHEARGAHSGEQPLEHMPSNGMHARRAVPVSSYMPVRDGEYRRPVETHRDQHFGRALYYGGHDLL